MVLYHKSGEKSRMEPPARIELALTDYETVIIPLDHGDNSRSRRIRTAKDATF